MLTNVENINYNAPSRWDRHFRYYMDTYAYEEHFFQMDPSLRQIRDLKEKYIRFNADCVGDERKAASELDALIAEYKSCSFSLFCEFARLLQKHRSAIIRSFSIVDTKVGKVRPSNGPTESLNRRPKDMKRNAVATVILNISETEFCLHSVWKHPYFLVHERKKSFGRSPARFEVHTRKTINSKFQKSVH